MNWRCLISGVVLIPGAVFAGSLPTLITPPQSQITSVGSNATFSVTATGATSYLWRFNGSDIGGANASTLVITNAQTTNAGYYSVLAQNTTGWVPGGMAYLSVLNGPPGLIPFNNTQDTNSAVFSYCGSGSPYVTNGTAQIVAGPQLDEMRPLGSPTAVVFKGRFNGSLQTIPFASVGQSIYYRVDVTAPNSCFNDFNPGAQPSAALAYLVTNTNPLLSGTCVGLRFPVYDEWPTPYFFLPYPSQPGGPTNQVVAPGETATFTVQLFDDLLNIPPSPVQWRKDGQNIPGATSVVSHGMNFPPSTSLSITNVQPEDAGVYDILAGGIYQSAISYKLTLNVQVANGQGVFQSPRTSGSSFVCDLAGIAGRQYDIQWSTNLSDWHDLQTVSNLTGFMTFSNSLASGAMQFYRTKLLPY